MNNLTEELLKEEKTVHCFYYTPNSSCNEMDITNVYEEDMDFINNNNLILTLEELRTGDIACYLRAEDEDEDEEVLNVNFGRSCQETIKELVEMYKKKGNEK